MSQTVDTDPRLRDEVQHHERARAAMTAMRRATAEAVGTFHEDYLEGKKNRYADDAGPDHSLAFSMARYRDDRLDDLADHDGPLFFGRLWFDSGESYHLGRRHVRDEEDRSTPLVVDWRAPVAERYYRASPHDRNEVSHRRRFGFRGSALSGFEDEDLRRGEDHSADVLVAEIERPRTGPMRDIVTTIQPEQDELIRRDVETSLCVQGAPGTGKTAVGLHRAAWLLYTFPAKFRREGMLVVGPNDGFLRYIAQVLPALGEASVTQVVVDDLTGAAGARLEEPAEVTSLKHDARMAEVCRQAVWDHGSAVRDDVIVPLAGVRWTLEADVVAEAVARARASVSTWDRGRRHVERALVQKLLRQHEVRARRTPDTRWVNQIKKQPAFKEMLDTVWPRLTAKQVLRKLWTDAELRASATRGVLTVEEAELLHRTTTTRLSAADHLVLDELQALISARGPATTYRHIVVDEAQDLSPMQCRAVARRCDDGSLTVLGDLAQGTTPWAASDWPTQMGHLGRPEAEHTALTTGFRVPAAIVELANGLVPHLGVDVPPGRSLRPGGAVEVLGSDDLVSGTVKAVGQALAHEGLVGVIATAPDLAVLAERLPADERLELVPAELAKGLEFDHVVLAEPAHVVDAPATGTSVPGGVGLRHLYVAVTRAVSRLTVVHTRDLPPQLEQSLHRG